MKNSRKLKQLAVFTGFIEVYDKSEIGMTNVAVAYYF